MRDKESFLRPTKAGMSFRICSLIFSNFLKATKLLKI
jgi:hypothetical protein